MSSTSTNTSSPAAKSKSPATPKTPSVGAIAGISIGSTAVAIAVIAGYMVWLVRRRRRNKTEGGIAPTLHDEDVEPFPPGLPVMQQREVFMSAGYMGKNRSGYGLGAPVAENAEPLASESTAHVATAADHPVGDESRLAELSRLIQQFRAELHSPPPSYNTEPE
ncbi:hypothetical protein PENSPDRAFT_242490 [Peniophora sp. CONT]|nr:hypothetical protein PENSPDRAFT_242490 [Peniophora sp. CONT]